MDRKGQIPPCSDSHPWVCPERPESWGGMHLYTGRFLEKEAPGSHRQQASPGRVRAVAKDGKPFVRLAGV